MERIDVYDRLGNFTGKVIDKDDDLGLDEYYAHCHVVLCHSSGLFLLQRRAMTKKHSPGVWDITGGGVNAGESWKEASMRETKEELGLNIPEEAMRLGWKKTGTDAGNYHLEVWGAKFDFDMNDIVLDRSEVDGAKLVPVGEYIEAVCWNKDDSYKAELTRFCAKLVGKRRENIGEGAVIGRNVTIGENAMIGAGAIIHANVCIGENAVIGAGAIIHSNVIIGENAIIGAGAIIHANATIAENDMISAGSVVY